MNLEAMDRREFLGKLAALTGGTAAVVTLLPAFEGMGTGGQLIAKDDARLETGYIEYPGETGKIRAYEARPNFQKLDGPANIKNFVAAVAYLKTGPQATGKVACTGFCWGGGVTNQVAVNAPDLTAAIPFYGMQPAPEDVAKILSLIHI